MENKKIISTEGEVYFHSRSVAVTILVKCQDEYLIVKRGNTSDFSNHWCLPCGYLDWDETIKEGAIRELYEETGIKTSSEDLILIGINDDPSSNKQNITFRFSCEFKSYPMIEIDNNEIIDCNWINKEQINNYLWAFNHDSIILNPTNEKLFTSDNY